MFFWDLDGFRQQTYGDFPWDQCGRPISHHPKFKTNPKIFPRTAFIVGPPKFPRHLHKRVPFMKLLRHLGIDHELRAPTGVGMGIETMEISMGNIS
jgi:hypothetical protein